MKCQRCKEREHSSSMAMAGLSTTPGVSSKREFRLCRECAEQTRNVPRGAIGLRCARCGGPEVFAAVEGANLCIDCWWPTNEVDAPTVVVHQTVDTMWQDMKEMQETSRMLKQLGRHEDAAKFQHILRVSAVRLAEASRRGAGELRGEAAEFVREQLGEPPFPSMLDVWMEDADFRKAYEQTRQTPPE